MVGIGQLSHILAQCLSNRARIFNNKAGSWDRNLSSLHSVHRLMHIPALDKGDRPVRRQVHESKSAQHTSYFYTYPTPFPARDVPC